MFPLGKLSACNRKHEIDQTEPRVNPTQAISPRRALRKSCHSVTAPNVPSFIGHVSVAYVRIRLSYLAHWPELIAAYCGTAFVKVKVERR